MTTQQRHAEITRRAAYLYGHSPEYTAALIELCDDLGCTIAPSQPNTWCVRRLDNRTHKCSHNLLPEGLCLGEVDHPLWLRWPDGQWALLSQTYGDWTDKVQAKRPDLTCIHLGLAPYGLGTIATLIIGADGPPLPEGMVESIAEASEATDLEGVA